MATASSAKRALRGLAIPERAHVNAGYFRTGPGEYGDGDRFIGVSMPDIRRVAREHRAMRLAEIAKLLASPIHEDRLLATVLLADRAAKAEPNERDEVARFYLAHLDRVNNWDLVDTSAPYVLGPYFEARSRRPLHRLARSRSVWRRRVAIVTTQHFIRKGEFGETLALARLLLHDDHDLIHKAVGWMLREVGKKDAGVLEAFLDEHAAVMPRTMLRYAIERLAEGKRKHLLARRSETR